MQFFHSFLLQDFGRHEAQLVQREHLRVVQFHRVGAVRRHASVRVQRRSQFDKHCEASFLI